jgi:hypothetical protein
MVDRDADGLAGGGVAAGEDRISEAGSQAAGCPGSTRRRSCRSIGVQLLFGAAILSSAGDLDDRDQGTSTPRTRE